MSHSVEVAILVGVAVVLASVLAVRISTRFGLPTLLVYLGLGMLLGEAGLGVHFANADLTRTLGLSALVLILAEGGLTTRWSQVRGAVPVGVSLATVGVAVSVAVVAVTTVLIFHTDWRTGVLLGAMVSSTDAAAVFSTLRRLPLRGRYAAALEVESGFNDAPTVILVLLISAGHGTSVADVAGQMVYELVVGAAVGIAVGLLGAMVLRRIALPVAGLYLLATVTFAVGGFALGSVIHASGFLAVYLAGLVLGNAGLPHHRAALGFAEGLAWLAQIGLFVLLGLLASPGRLTGVIVPALGVGAVLLVLARPLSVWFATQPFGFRWRGQALLSWAGLRGAVPIVLATVPISARFPRAERLFDIVFVLVIVFTLIQGTALPPIARWLQVVDVTPAREVTVESAPLDAVAADLLHVTVGAGSRLHGVYVVDLRLPEGAALSLVVRDGRSFVPDRETRLAHGDELLLVTARSARTATERRMRAVSRAGALARWRGERGL